MEGVEEEVSAFILMSEDTFPMQLPGFGWDRWVKVVLYLNLEDLSMSL